MHDYTDKSPRYDQHGKLTFLAAGKGWVMCRRPFHEPFAMMQGEWDALSGSGPQPDTSGPCVYVRLAVGEPPKPDAVIERQRALAFWESLFRA